MGEKDKGGTPSPKVTLTFEFDQLTVYTSFDGWWMPGVEIYLTYDLGDDIEGQMPVKGYGGWEADIWPFQAYETRKLNQAPVEKSGHFDQVKLKVCLYEVDRWTELTYLFPPEEHESVDVFGGSVEQILKRSDNWGLSSSNQGSLEFEWPNFWLLKVNYSKS